MKESSANHAQLAEGHPPEPPSPKKKALSMRDGDERGANYFVSFHRHMSKATSSSRSVLFVMIIVGFSWQALRFYRVVSGTGGSANRLSQNRGLFMRLFMGPTFQGILLAIFAAALLGMIVPNGDAARAMEEDDDDAEHMHMMQPSTKGSATLVKELQWVKDEDSGSCTSAALERFDANASESDSEDDDPVHRECQRSIGACRDSRDASSADAAAKRS